MRIITDLDDVIANFVPYLLEFLNSRYNSNLNFENLKGWNIWEYCRLKREEYEEGIKIFIQEGHYGNLTVVKGAKEALDKLNKKGDNIYIVTWRNRKVKTETEEWLKRNSITYNGIFFSDHKSKEEICKTLEADVIIDDSGSQARIMSCFCHVLLYDKPWNQNAPRKIRRVYNWEDILDEIENQKRGRMAK